MLESMFLLATIQQVKNRWISTDIPPSDEIIEQYIRDACLLLESQAPNIVGQTQDDENVKARVELVICTMVIRALSNPDKIRQLQESTGPYSGGVTFGTETLGGLEVTKEDMKILFPRKRTIGVVSPLGMGQI